MKLKATEGQFIPNSTEIVEKIINTRILTKGETIRGVSRLSKGIHIDRSCVKNY